VTWLWTAARMMSLLVDKGASPYLDLVQTSRSMRRRHLQARGRLLVDIHHPQSCRRNLKTVDQQGHYHCPPGCSEIAAPCLEVAEANER